MRFSINVLFNWIIVVKILRTIAVITFSAWLASACAISYPSNLGSINAAVQFASGTGNVTVLLRDGTATLVGVVQSRVDANKAVKAAQSADGVDRVIDFINVRN